MAAKGWPSMGEIIAINKVAKTKFGSNDPELEDDGVTPKMQLVVILQTSNRNWDKVAKAPQAEDGSPKDPALDEGKRAYWVCPLVEESEKSDLAAAEDRYEELRRKFGDAVDLVHGKMKGAEKDAAMARFAAGESRLLVATTVIEVGVDVPEATIMVIEHAERFGLAQIHQLRGRVGRGSGKSTCLLLYRAPLGETAKARLAILRDSEDGFRIAEEDLRLRGEGDVLGTRQSGMPGFRIARPEVHGKYLGAARDDAQLVLSRDPSLTSARGQALQQLLYLFGKDEAITLIRAG